MPNAEAPTATLPSPRALSVVYFAYFGALGGYGPFLAVLLEHRGFSSREVTNLLALLPILRVLATPSWTLLADRVQSAGFVLRVVTMGTFLAFALLEFFSTKALIAASLVAFTLFRSPTSSLLDVTTLAWARRTGGAFGQLRVWGTVGYTLCTFLAGVVIARRGAAYLVHFTVLLLALAVLSTLPLPAGTAPPKPHLLASLGLLLRRPRFVRLVLAASLHQLGLAAYDSLYPAYVTRIAGGVWAGAAVACGAAAEVAFMARAKTLLGRWGLVRGLCLAYGAGAVRWVVLAYATHPALLVGAQLLHALVFGAFYMAAVAMVDQDAPQEVRASAQGVFAALVWGLASGIALLCAGWLRESGGMPRVFLGASVASVGALAITLLWRDAPAPAEPRPAA